MQNIYKKKSFAFKHRVYNYDIDYDYIDARNGIMPIIKIKLEKIRRI